MRKEFEKCISCGDITDVNKDTLVENRRNYVDGCGQMCSSCYDKIYGVNLKTSNKLIYLYI